MSSNRCQFPCSFTTVLLATIYLLLSGQALARPLLLPREPQQPPEEPPQEGEIAYMFGFQNPIRSTSMDSNALVYINPLGFGGYGQTALVRSLVSGRDGLPGCEVACVRKTGSLRDMKTGELYTGERKTDIHQMALDEISNHRKIQRRFDRSGSRDDFFPRGLAYKEYKWPGLWPGDPTPTTSVEFYQELIQGRSLMKTLMSPVLSREDGWSLGVQYMKYIVSAVQAMRQWDRPMMHFDMHAANVMVGWKGEQAPVPTANDLGTRAFLIDFGLARETTGLSGTNADGQDLMHMRYTLERIMTYSGLGLKDLVKGWLKTVLSRSPAERAFRKGYLLLRGAVTEDDDGDAKLKSGAQVLALYDSLQKIYTGVPEKYTKAFQSWATTPAYDVHAEPMRYSSKNELARAGRTYRVSGPWHPTEVKRIGNAWVVQNFQENIWCDWDICFDSSKSS